MRNYISPVKYFDSVMVSATMIFYHYKFSEFLAYKTDFN